MRKLIIAATTAALLSVAGPAFAGPGGTSEDSANNLSCGVGTVAPPPGTNVQVNTEGGPEGGAAVICNDGAPAPIQGRVIASGSTSGGGYIAVDGDKDNPEQARGWARVDVDTTPTDNVRCGGPTDAGSGTNAESPSGGKREYCG